MLLAQRNTRLTMRETKPGFVWPAFRPFTTLRQEVTRVIQVWKSSVVIRTGSMAGPIVSPGTGCRPADRLACGGHDECGSRSATACDRVGCFPQRPPAHG